MAFPTIPTVAAGRVLFANQADTSGTRTFPSLSSLTKNAGDLLIAVITTYQSTTNPQFSSWGGGFTELSAGGDQGSATTMGIGVAYKISTGSETGTFTVTQAATITGHASMCLMSIPLANSVILPEAGTIANGTSSAADPGSFNPAGWGTEDTLWIAVDGNGMTSGTGSWTKCGAGTLTNYSSLANSATTDSSTVGQTEIAVSFRQANAASEDRGAVSTHDTSNARNSALIIAIPPVITGALAGIAAESFGAGSSVMVGAGALAGAAAQTFAGTPVIGGAGALAGAASGTFAHTAVMQAVLSAAGTTAIAFGEAATLDGSGALAGVAALTFGQVASFTGAGALSGVAAGTFGQLAMVTGAAPLSGVATATFAVTGVVVGAGELAATGALAFTHVAALAGAGAMAGTSAATFSGTLILTGAGALLGTSGITFTETSVLAGAGALVGTVSAAFDTAGTLDLPEPPEGEMAGAAAMAFAGIPALTGAGILSGLTSLAFTKQGVLLADGALAGVSVMALIAQAGLLGSGEPEPEPEGDGLHHYAAGFSPGGASSPGIGGNERDFGVFAPSGIPSGGAGSSPGIGGSGGGFNFP